jgi:hypothetical protein
MPATNTSYLKSLLLIAHTLSDIGDINLAWPNSEIAVMGAAGAVNIIFRGLGIVQTGLSPLSSLLSPLSSLLSPPSSHNQTSLLLIPHALRACY